jgi:FlaA1/EpsC-like NDP-sugar epimerase
VALLSVFGLAVAGRHMFNPYYKLSSLIELLPFLIMTLGGLGMQGLYPGVLLHRAKEMRRIFIAIISLFLIMTCATFLLGNAEAYSRAVFILTWLVGAPVVLAGRHLTRVGLSDQRWWGVSAIVLGSGAGARRVLKLLHNGRRGIRVIGVLSDDIHTPWPDDLPPILGTLDSAPELARTGAAKYAILGTSEQDSEDPRRILQECCTGFSQILIVPEIPSRCSLGVSALELGGELALNLPQRLFHKWAAWEKRIIDIFFSLSLLTILAPAFLAIAVAIKMASKGPIFYGQHPLFQ